MGGPAQPQTGIPAAILDNVEDAMIFGSKAQRGTKLFLGVVAPRAEISIWLETNCTMRRRPWHGDRRKGRGGEGGQQLLADASQMEKKGVVEPRPGNVLSL